MFHSRLRADASIDAGLIDVQVDDNQVTLSGSVGSATEKSEAETEAWIVAGVESVNNKIDVQWWLDGDQDDWGDGWTDADMQDAIEICRRWGYHGGSSFRSSDLERQRG